jgi:hypothetical protein
MTSLNKKKVGVLALSIIIILSCVPFVFADTVTGLQPDQNIVSGFDVQSSLLAPIPGLNAQSAVDLKTYLKNIFKFIIGGAGVLAVVYVFWGGFQFATEESITGKSDAKNKIYNALKGLGLTLAAWLIINTINPQLLSLNITDIKQQSVRAIGDMSDLTFNQKDLDYIKQATAENEAYQTTINEKTAKISELNAKIAAAQKIMDDNEGSETSQAYQDAQAESNRLNQERNTLQSEKDDTVAKQKANNYNALTKVFSGVVDKGLNDQSSYDYLKTQSEAVVNTALDYAKQMNGESPEKRQIAINFQTNQALANQTIAVGDVMFTSQLKYFSIDKYKEAMATVNTTTDSAVAIKGQTPENIAALKANAEKVKQALRTDCATRAKNTGCDSL